MRNKIFFYLILILLISSSFRVLYAQSEDYSNGLIDELQLQRAYALDVPYSKETEPEISTLTINKTLISGVWHVGCDVMGNQTWVKDEISNPQGIPSREGHRLAYCGDPSHWIIYLDTSGRPIMMDEIKSGSTGGTLHTKFYTDGTYTVEKSISDIHIGERIYWTTWNGDQVWHHTGVTTPEVPEFDFVVDGIEYSIAPGKSLSLDLPVGVYKIVEKYDPDYFVSQVSIPYVVTEDSNVVVQVYLSASQETVVNFTNQRITPDPPSPPETEPPQPVTETETQTETETETESETETQTESETETESESESEVIIESESETQSEAQPETQKQTQKPVQTEKPETQKPTEAVTERQTEKVTEKITERQTEKVTEQQTEKITEQPTEKVTERQTQKVTKRQTEKVTERIPQTTPETPAETEPKQPEQGQGEVSPTQESGVQSAHRLRDKEKNQKFEKVSGDVIIIPIQTESIPKTGDETPILKLICQLLLSFGIILILAYVIRNRRD